MTTPQQGEEVVKSRIYDILVEVCGASEASREQFVQTDWSEWRFQGSLGFGGKVYLDGNKARVSCYPEDETPERNETIAEANHRLKLLLSHTHTREEASVEEALDTAIRDICSVSVAPASKSEVRRILTTLTTAIRAEAKREERRRIEHSLPTSVNGTYSADVIHGLLTDTIRSNNDGV